MPEGKIIDYLGEDDQGNRKFVLLLPPEEEYETPVDEVMIAHDYVRFRGSYSFEMLQKDGKYPYTGGKGACNWVSSRAEVTIGIREFQEIVLPHLTKHKYMQPEHLADRENGEDDKYFAQYGLTKPRWTAKDTYPPYTFNACVVRLYEEGKGTVYYCRRVGEKAYDILTSTMFKMVRKSLKLHFSIWEINKKS